MMNIDYKLFYEALAANFLSKDIWQQFMKKIDLDVHSMIDHSLAELEPLIEDGELLAKNCTDFSSAFKESKTGPASSFIKNTNIIGICVNIIPPTSDQIAKLQYLVLKMLIMKVRYL